MRASNISLRSGKVEDPRSSASNSTSILDFFKIALASSSLNFRAASANIK